MFRFPSHGEFATAIDGPIVKVVASGTPNLETMQDFTARMAEIVGTFGGKPFAVYSEFNGDILLPPDAEQRLRESIAERVRRGMVAAALQLQQSNCRYLILSQFGNVCGDLGVPLREFPSYEEAKVWLLDRIAGAESCR